MNNHTPLLHQSLTSLISPRTFTLKITEDLLITFCDQISLGELEAIAEQISSSCITEQQYLPGCKKPLLLYYLLTKMSNADFFHEEADTIDLELAFSLYKSSVGQTICSHWDDIPLVRMLEETIEEKISYRKDQLRIDQRIVEFVNAGYRTFDHIQEDIQSMTSQINGAMKNLDPEKLNTANEKALELLKQFDPESVKKLSESLHLGMEDLSFPTTDEV